jgi:isoquinoline 1-oxidoreductase beta subunit
MNAPSTMDRRAFLKLTALAGGGLVLGVRFGSPEATAQVTSATATDFAPNAFIAIARDGKVTLFAPNSEMGQGAKTALPMILAEELDVPWASVRVVQADLDPAYGAQNAVGSQSTPGNYASLRKAGATARAMLVAAAAETWNVPATECATDQGAVVHRATNRSLPYGALTTRAAALTPPANPPLKDPKDFKLIGTRVPGVDNPAIVTGQPLFGIDVKLPGMVYAAYVKCPVFGGRVAHAELDPVKALPGVRDAFVLDGIAGLPSGVAVVADSTWTAFKAAQQLRVTWDRGAGANQNSEEMAKQAESLGRGAMTTLPTGGTTVEAVYHYPFLAHATLEPQNCTALFRGGKFEMWVPSQVPGRTRRLVSEGCRVAPADVTVHVTRLGGGFGRRGSNEFSLEAAAIAHRFEGTPVKLTWTRAQDFAHDNYRSNGWHFLQGAVDAAGKVTALHDSFVKLQGGPGDMTASGFPFTAIPGSQVRSNKIPATVPTGYWRAPGDNGNTWAMQSFVDELAHAARRDPLEFTQELLAAVPAPANASGRGFIPARMLHVLKLAAEKAGWGKKLPRGEGQGLAITHTNNAYVALVAEVAVSREGALGIKRLTAAVDCGTVINLSSAESQVQGAILDGIGAAWFLEMTIAGGAAQPENFEKYPLLRMTDVPPVLDVHFVESTNPPTGLGEPGLPPAAPAVCNAIFAATGKRIRTLPFARENLRWT